MPAPSDRGAILGLMLAAVALIAIAVLILADRFGVA